MPQIIKEVYKEAPAAKAKNTMNESFVNKKLEEHESIKNNIIDGLKKTL